MADSTPVLDELERIKAESRLLRGSLHIGLEDPVTGGIDPADTGLVKFHGIYQQDDRDLRAERRRARLEPDYSFMVRVRIPGGRLSPAQWLKLDQLARERGNGTVRLTTRQAVQFHGVYKDNLRPLIRGLEAVQLDSLAACGDVNRNVMCTPNPHSSGLHQRVHAWTVELAGRLLPRTGAYREIWLEGKVGDGQGESEPLYGPTYLPRKFKTAVVIPPENDVDVLAHDLGFIAIGEGDRLEGFNLTAGGGMGMSFDHADTFPRLADVIGFFTPAAALEAAEAVVSIQRDFGNRSNRKRARLKYTIEDRGLEWFRRELAWRARVEPGLPRPFAFTHNGDRYGWVEGEHGLWHLTVFVENGRLRSQQLDVLRALAGEHDGEFRLTPNQNLIVANVPAAGRERVDEAMRAAGLDRHQRATGLRLHAMACVALPTCPLAMAESERYLPGLIDRIEVLLVGHGLETEAITLRMTGCPNGCARPYLAEIGLVGKAPGRYNLYLGGTGDGSRLNRLYRENLDEAAIVEELDTLFGRYAHGREAGERFGDYLIREAIIEPVTRGLEVRVIGEAADVTG